MKVLCSSCGATLKVPKKSQDEYWQDVPTKTGEIEVDYVGALKNFVIQFLPAAVVVGLLAWFAYFLSSQIIVGKGNLPTLAKVAGKVTVNGKPVAGATVRFVPLEETGDAEKRGASVSLGMTGEDGHYSLLYVRDVPGAPVGRNRVEIEWKDISGFEQIRPEYNVRSTLVREVNPGQNEIDFDVQAMEKPPRVSPSTLR